MLSLQQVFNLVSFDLDTFTSSILAVLEQTSADNIPLPTTIVNAMNSIKTNLTPFLDVVERRFQRIEKKVLQNMKGNVELAKSSIATYRAENMEYLESVALNLFSTMRFTALQITDDIAQRRDRLKMDLKLRFSIFIEFLKSVKTNNFERDIQRIYKVRQITASADVPQSFQFIVPPVYNASKHLRIVLASRIELYIKSATVQITQLTKIIRDASTELKLAVEGISARSQTLQRLDGLKSSFEAVEGEEFRMQFHEILKQINDTGFEVINERLQKFDEALGRVA